MSEDGDNDTRWMTFKELADARGIGAGSAKVLARRKRWRRMPGNDGRVKVAVPREYLPDPKPPEPEPAEAPAADPVEVEDDVDRLRSEVDQLKRLLDERHGEVGRMVVVIEGLRDDHRKTIEHLAERHRVETDRLIDQHRAEVERLVDALRQAQRPRGLAGIVAAWRKGEG